MNTERDQLQVVINEVAVMQAKLALAGIQSGDERYRPLAGMAIASRRRDAEGYAIALVQTLHSPLYSDSMDLAPSLHGGVASLVQVAGYLEYLLPADFTFPPPNDSEAR